MTTFRTFLLATAIAAACCPAFAQDSRDAVATLRVDAGPIMASTGGEFATVNTGKPLVEGERLMVADGGIATVRYDNGCTRQYAEPGVYVIQEDCVPAAIAAGGVDWRGAALISAGVGVGAAILANQDDSPGPGPAPEPPPVSR